MKLVFPEMDGFGLAIADVPEAAGANKRLLDIAVASSLVVLLAPVLREGADFVVIDCGPVDAGPEAGAIVRLADATVLVSKHQVLRSPLMASAAKSLQGTKTEPIGIVITKQNCHSRESGNLTSSNGR